MAKDGIQIDIDKNVMNNLQKQFTALGTTMDDAGPRAIFKVLMKIKTEAQLRLTGRGHIITSRLKNSIYVKMKGFENTKDNSLTYSDKPGNTYSSDLSTVHVGELEGAVGTNVEYAAPIELGFKTKNGGVFAGDSYLYWALKNVDISKGVGEDLAESLRKNGRFSK